jgi:hypothetical protein
LIQRNIIRMQLYSLVMVEIRMIHLIKIPYGLYSKVKILIW